MKATQPADRPLREWPLEQLAEQAALHAADAEALAVLAWEARHRRGARAKALEARLARMIAACAPTPSNEAVRLRATLSAAAREIVALRAQIVALERNLARQDLAPEAADPYRRVHLTPDAPAWLIAEVRRAFRRRHHPDTTADPQGRRRSEEVFKRAEASFAAIARLRET